MARKIRATCYDHLNLVSGKIIDATDWGCEILSYDASGSTPAFPRKTNIRLDLLDETSGESLCFVARLTGVSRRNNTWSYRIRWQSLPDFLKE